MSEQRGQRVDPAGVARMPLPTPEPPNIQAMYSGLMKEYNLLYSAVRGALMDANRLSIDDLPDTDVLARLAADAIKAQTVMAEDNRRERELWRKDEARWRALDLVAKHKPQAGAGGWISAARDIVNAVESDDFLG